MRHLLTALILPLSTLAQPDAVREGQSIPFAQLGMEADKKGAEAASSITPTATGAHLKALMQDLEAEATPEGLWLSSTAEDDLGTPNRFRIRAVGVGSGSSPRFDEEPPGGLLHFPTTGLVRVTEDTVVWIRPGLIEEYRVSTDGVR